MIALTVMGCDSVADPQNETQSTNVPQALSLVVGEKRQINSAASATSVTWWSDNPWIAPVSTSGLISAISPGIARITRRIRGRIDTSVVTVRAVVSAVHLSSDSTPLALGGSMGLSYQAFDSHGQQINDLQGAVVRWTSRNDSVATVDSTGLIRSRGVGSALIILTIDGQSDSASVHVAPPGTPVPIDPAAPTNPPSDPSNPPTNPNTPAPNPPSDPNTPTQPITPVTATVAVTLDSVSLAAGHAAHAHAIALDSKGRVLSGKSVSWSGSNSAVATVSSSGVVTAKSAGTLSVQANVDGVNGSANLRVWQPYGPRPDSVTLVLDAGTYASGSYALEATTTVGGVAKVQFIVDGAVYHAEAIAKYCLFGGDASCASGSLGGGAHSIQAKVLNSSGTSIGVSSVLSMVDGSTSSAPAAPVPPPSAPTSPAAPTTSQPGVIASANFEDGTLGAFYDFNSASHAVSVVSDPLNAGHGKVVKIHYNVQTSGANQDDNEGIATAVNGIGLGSEFWFSGDFMIPAGSDMVNVQRKLVYWGWSRDNWGFQQAFQFNLKAFGPQFCTSNIPWNAADGVVSSSGDGQHYIDTKVAQLTAGVWHHLMIHMKINSSFTAADGIQEITYDGITIFSDHGMQWTNPAWDPVANPPSTYQWVFWQIGQQADASVTAVEDRYWDNVTFSRSPLP